MANILILRCTKGAAKAEIFESPTKQYFVKFSLNGKYLRGHDYKTNDFDVAEDAAMIVVPLLDEVCK